MAEVFKLGNGAVGDKFVRNGEDTYFVYHAGILLYKVIRNCFAETAVAYAVFDSDDAAVVGGGDLI